MVLEQFHPVIAAWFRTRFREPTEVQSRSWPSIVSGTHALIAAPTGSGKTLAAFLACIDSLFKQALSCQLEDRTQVIYVSPLKALSNDIQKNLREPLTEITQAAHSAGFLLPDLRAEVRTGDTPQHIRQQLLRCPPHILVTTPESLYLLLTARKSRALLSDVRTVIVDEIHALAPNKRGAHLALSLERLEALCRVSPVRIGLSATQRPLEEIARFLVGVRGQREVTSTEPSSMVSKNKHYSLTLFPQGRRNSQEVEDDLPCHIVDVGQRRHIDLSVEVPGDELGAIATNAIWSDVYDRVAELARQHRSTLVFVNTRRLAERVAHHLAERLGEDQVASHHGSLSRKIRLSAEERLKQGQTRVVVATASLELGIDIGHVDLVCHIGSPRSIATCIQRVGRAGHWVGAVPKGRLFCTTRDELVECAAVIHAIQQGNLDPVSVPLEPLDILAQQVVAEVATQEWAIEDMYWLVTRAYPYRQLKKETFEAVLNMVVEGYVLGRRRQQAFVFRDRIHQTLRARRGARLAALTSGGAIPDSATYAVVAEPEGTVVGTVDEDFAVESLAGDIMLLGTTSWRIRGIETGRMRVEDAHGASPTIPFWRGEAPSRTAELSNEVAQLREHVKKLIEDSSEDRYALVHSWLQAECGLNNAGAAQVLTYIREGMRVLGGVPTQKCIIAERFFDESGGMQLVIHAPFGGRLTRAWGLALRKRFCVNFDFELQAAATDEGLVLSLGEKHSFPLDAIFSFLHSKTVREVLIQALLGSPLFLTRWRWNVSRALALLRFQRGKKVPLHIQRMRAEDLLASAFPLATACQDNHVGDIPVPDHPLVQETVRDCLSEAMDVEGLVQILEKIEQGAIQCIAVESPAPSPFSHEILNANPYAFLDDAPLEERRARAVNLRQTLRPELGDNLGSLDPSAISEVLEEAWPTVRDADELHEALHLLVWVPEEQGVNWHEYLPVLVESGRAVVVEVAGEREKSPVRGWVTSEHFGFMQKLFPQTHIVSDQSLLPRLEPSESSTEEECLILLVRGWMECCGPVTSGELASKLCLPESPVQSALGILEAEGKVLRGHFRPSLKSAASPLGGDLPARSRGVASAKAVGRGEEGASAIAQQEWCDRHLLSRIHRRTIVSLRREIEPVSGADFMRFLFRWQHCALGSQLHGEAGLREVIKQLAGYEAPASAWESSLLKERLSSYKPELLDMLCLKGEVSWGRLTPPFKENVSGPTRSKTTVSEFVLEPGVVVQNLRRITPTSLAPISFFLREDTPWLSMLAKKRNSTSPHSVRQALSGVAQDLLHCLESRGASFFADLKGSTGHVPAQIESALWELVAAGFVTADGFDNLRALLDPKRRRAEGKERARRPRHSAGRWDLLRTTDSMTEGEEQQDSHMDEQWARQLLRRYGVVFRDLLKRESMPMTWRELLGQYRRLEWRGEIRGGRFVNGCTGEQFALPEAIEALRAVRRDAQAGAQELRLSGADPLNLVGIILPGERVPALPSKTVRFRNGVPVIESSSVAVFA